MRKRILSLLLRWLAVILILRVLGTILSNYSNYFPANFESSFLQAREQAFHGVYRIAFYLHIASGPIVLVNGLVLLMCSGQVHRWLGRVQAVTVLFLLLPSGAVMARQSFGGWPAGLSFLSLAVATGSCTILGVVNAIRGRYRSHRTWMLRSYILICSAVVLRIVSGAAEVIGVSKPEDAYIAAAWISWLLPLAAFEIAERTKLRI